MNGILGMTELALSTTLSEEQREFLLTVKSSADRLLTIIMKSTITRSWKQVKPFWIRLPSIYPAWSAMC
jgi:signal transduction histidine kinase